MNGGNRAGAGCAGSRTRTGEDRRRLAERPGLSGKRPPWPFSGACALPVLTGLAAAGMVLWPGPVPGAADPPALTGLRQKYQALLTEVERPARVQWLQALQALEKAKAAAGDWEGAEAVRLRRESLMNPAGAEAAAGNGQSTVVLRASAAKGSAGLDYADGRKEVARFRRTGAMLEWELSGTTAGNYEVRLVFAVMGAEDLNDSPDPCADPAAPLPARSGESTDGTAAGGVVEFRKISSLREGAALLRRSVRSTGGWAATRTLTLGTVPLDGKIAKFSLKAVDALPAGVMDFHRLELVPAAAQAAAASDRTGLKELARLREVYQKQFAAQTRSLAARYQKSLDDLEAAASRSRDSDLLALIRQERERLQRSRDGSTATGGEGAGPAGAAPDPAAARRVLPVTERLHMLLRGEVKLTNQGDYLTRMRPAHGCEVTWKLSGFGVTSGTYSVEVECRLLSGHGGAAELAASTPGGSPGPALRFRVRPPALNPGDAKRKSGQSSTTFTAGVVSIPKGSEYLTLRVTALAEPDGGLFDLKSLRLTPVAPPSSPPSPKK